MSIGAVFSGLTRAASRWSVMMAGCVFDGSVENAMPTAALSNVIDMVAVQL